MPSRTRCVWTRSTTGVFVIGASASGQLLEVLARVADDGELVVFHAMALRSVNAERYVR